MPDEGQDVGAVRPPERRAPRPRRAKIDARIQFVHPQDNGCHVSLVLRES